MRKSRIVGVNEEIHGHSGSVSRNDGNIAIVGDQRFGSYPLSAVILVEAVPRYVLCPAPADILPPGGMRGWFQFRPETSNELPMPPAYTSARTMDQDCSLPPRPRN